jgi:hypothetical protein
MKNVLLISVLFIAFVLVVYSEAKKEQLFQMKHRQVEVRRLSSQCELCGALRRPCCFPNLCQHRPPKISKCYKV